MYQTNIKHLLDASRKMQDDLPREPKELIGFLIKIIDSTTRSLHNTLTTSDVKCFEKGCEGIIKTAIRPDNEEIHWYCPACEKEGLINNWQGTEWDQRNST
jgi:hypothetical protein